MQNEAITSASGHYCVCFSCVSHPLALRYKQVCQQRRRPFTAIHAVDAFGKALNENSLSFAPPDHVKCGFAVFLTCYALIRSVNFRKFPHLLLWWTRTLLKCYLYHFFIPIQVVVERLRDCMNAEHCTH
jgi:hypothetical protein